MKKTLMFFVALSCAPLFGLNVESVISKMDAAGRKTAIGKDSSCGSYIVCREEVAVQGDVNVAREQAKLNARQTIAELISVKVSVESVRTTTTKETINDEDESFEQSEFAKSVARKDAKQMQRGISVCKESVSGGKIVVYCLLTEQVVDATAELEKAMQKLGPDTVQTTGVGYYNEVVPVAKAHEVAIAEAQRNAIAEVLGMSMTSSSAKQSISAESVDKDGNESFACDDSFKAKTFSACAGFVEHKLAYRGDRSVGGQLSACTHAHRSDIRKRRGTVHLQSRMAIVVSIPRRCRRRDHRFIVLCDLFPEHAVGACLQRIGGKTAAEIVGVRLAGIADVKIFDLFSSFGKSHDDLGVGIWIVETEVRIFTVHNKRYAIVGTKRAIEEVIKSAMSIVEIVAQA